MLIGYVRVSKNDGSQVSARKRHQRSLYEVLARIVALALVRLLAGADLVGAATRASSVCRSRGSYQNNWGGRWGAPHVGRQCRLNQADHRMLRHTIWRPPRNAAEATPDHALECPCPAPDGNPDHAPDNGYG